VRSCCEGAFRRISIYGSALLWAGGAQHLCVLERKHTHRMWREALKHSKPDETQWAGDAFCITEKGSLPSLIDHVTGEHNHTSILHTAAHAVSRRVGRRVALFILTA